LGFANPPVLLYFYMLRAALSDNPVLVMLLNSFFAVTAVFLTHLFVTRYYGRFAGAVAGLLYAAAPVPLIYSRFIWQPNMMQPFVVLFFLALFRGVVDRRTGWLPLALLWLAILLQTHLTVLLLVVPLFMRCSSHPRRCAGATWAIPASPCWLSSFPICCGSW